MAANRFRREFLAGVGGLALTGLAGCTGVAQRIQRVDRTLYVGAYHWGFILLDEHGVEQERVSLERGTNVKFVGFSLEAHEAVESLPSAVREELPSHEQLEARNRDRIPAPSEEYLHEALEAAEAQYPTHSFVVVPAGGGHMNGGMMDGGMMGRRGLELSQEATEPVETVLTAGQRGRYSIDCGAYCGYGHRYMEKPGVIVVQ